ncbi:MAG: class I SAM-dependent methyltransferase [Myxococcota bacterium]
MTSSPRGGRPPATPPSAVQRRLLEQLEAQLDVAALTPLSHERCLESHNIFEGASDQRRQIARHLGGVAPDSASDGEFSVLSIGCGGGELDREVVRSLAERFPRLRYTGVDPNPVEATRCRAFVSTATPEAEVAVEAVVFEDFTAPAASFDIAYAVHTLYYLAEVDRAIARARRMLRDGGQLIVFQAPRGLLNQLSAVFWEAQLGRRIRFSEDLGEICASGRPTVARFDAEVDVTPCLEAPSSAAARALRDFILQFDTAFLAPRTVELVDEYLCAISRRTAAGAWRSPHPVDVFVWPSS